MKILTRAAAFLCLSLIALFGGSVFAGTAPAAEKKDQSIVYQLKDAAVVDGPEIYASEILDPSPDGTLGQLSLGRVGRPGALRSLTREFVANRVERSIGENSPRIEGKLCLVTASSQDLRGEQLVAFARQYLDSQLQNLSGTAKISIEDGSVPRVQKVPNKQVTLSIDAATRAALRGNVVLTVKAYQDSADGKRVQVSSTPISFKVRVEEQVLVASKAIARRADIGPENSSLMWKDTTYVKEQAYTNYSELGGLRTKTSLAAGSILVPSVMDLPPLVKKGDFVWLHVIVGGIELDVQAKALEDGRQDEMIRIEVVDKNKKMMARVLDSGTVVSAAR